MTSLKRRDLLFTSAKMFGAVGIVGAVWPIAKSFGPTADMVPQYETFALDKVAPGQQVTFVVKGSPYLLRHLTPTEIEDARNVPLSELRDRDARSDNFLTDEDDPRFLSERASEPKNATVENRLIDPSMPYILLLGICPRLGCVPVHHEGDYGGWFCPCGGSHFDTVGRIRRGPASTNLHIPKAHIEGSTLILPHPIA